jgi:hypothetical protein
MYDRIYGESCGHKGCAPWSDQLLTTYDEARDFVGSLLLDTIGAEQMEFFEDELERDEEFKLANWMRKLRHERESVEEERARYEHDDKLAEELARRRRRRRPRN